MRIFYICHITPSTSDVPLFLAHALSRAGHDVALYPADTEHTETLRARFLNTTLGWNQGLLQHIHSKHAERACVAFKPDIVLCAGTHLEPGAPARLRRTGCRVGFLLDRDHLAEGHTRELIAAMDFAICHDSHMMPVVRTLIDGPILHAPGAADPATHRPMPLTDEQQTRLGGDIAFVGGWSTHRSNFLKRLTTHDLRLWGYRWQMDPALAPFFRDEAVYGAKKLRIYSASRIVVNLEDPDKQTNSLNPRIPEVLSCGGFVLTCRTADLEACGFRDGEHIAWFETPEELADKAAHYLAHADERHLITERGRALVLEKLTYQRLATDLTTGMQEVLAS